MSKAKRYLRTVARSIAYLFPADRGACALPPLRDYPVAPRRRG